MTDTTQSALLPKYAQLLSTVKIRPSAAVEAKKIADRIVRNLSSYRNIELKTKIPWWFVAGLHSLECDLNFTQHLANGDPIDRPTILQPRGIPAGTWEECAIAALALKTWCDGKTFWTNPLVCLWRAEMWNGWGYQQYHPDVPSPYLWGGTNHYSQGKYTSDGVWDATAVSQQVGVVAIWMALGIDLLLIQLVGTVSDVSNLGGKDMEPIGRLIIDKIDGTWIKTSTASADTLPETGKQLVPCGQSIPFYANPGLLGGHYAIDIKSGGDIARRYCYNGHAHIEMVDRPSAVIPVAAPKHSIAIGDKKAIQKELIRVGLLDPIADGKWGSLSQSAWRAFTRVIGCQSEDLSQPALDRLVAFKSFKDLDFKPKDPSDEENVLAVKCVKRMVALSFHLTISMGSESPAYNILYAAGINPNGTLNSNKIDEWNDLRFLIEVAQDGTVIKHGCWLATIDAGWYWRGDNRMNSDGALQINMDRQFLGCSCFGRHGARKYKALVQCGEITATRDRLGDGRTSDDTKDEGLFGSNDHHGWDSEKVGINSAGCVVGRSKASHEKFMGLLALDRRYKCNNGFAWNRNILSGKNI